MGHMLEPQSLHTAKTANLQAGPVIPGLTQRQTLQKKLNPNHRAELMLKSQWEGKGLCTEHFPQQVFALCCMVQPKSCDFRLRVTVQRCQGACTALGKGQAALPPSGLSCSSRSPFGCFMHLLAYHTQDLHVLSLSFYHKTIEGSSFFSSHGFLRFPY